MNIKSLSVTVVIALSLGMVDYVCEWLTQGPEAIEPVARLVDYYEPEDSEHSSSPEWGFFVNITPQQTMYTT